MGRLDRIPELLFYAALLGMAVLLMETVIGRIKAPAKNLMGI